jgi:dienelactone hydrolase
MQPRHQRHTTENGHSITTVIARFFHTWEHRLASVSKDRIVRPFEWGTDWIGGTSVGNTRADVERWVDAVMRDSDSFFAAPPTSDYEFAAATAHVRDSGEAGTLRFPSAVVTPHAENNIVTARWFPTPDRRRSDRRDQRRDTRDDRSSAGSGARGRAVVILPQWNSDAGGHVGLAKVLARFGVSALRLSLPYHDVRMPPELTRADYIVSSNIVRTLQVCRQAVVDARRAVAWLHMQGFERIGILGTSLGSCLAMLTAAHEPRIKAQALNHVSPFFADVVWRGLSTRHVREGLEGHVDLETLRHLWRPISPWSYLERARHTRTLLVYAKYDLTFPVDLSRMLVDEWARRGLPHEVAVLPCGHYSTGAAPFKFIDAYTLTRFLRNAL